MDIFFDLNSKGVWFGAIGSEDIQKVKIRQFEDIRLQFVRGSTPERLEASATISLRLKLTKEAATTLASCSSWTRPAADSGYYTGTMSLNTTQITTSLFDLTANAETDEFTVFFELEWAPAADATAVRKSDDASIVLVRSVVTGTESAATDTTAATALQTLTSITALTGGTSTCLDAVATLNVSVGKLVALAITNEFQIWQLQSGTAAENAANGIVRPDDYAATSNEKIWFRLV